MRIFNKERRLLAALRVLHELDDRLSVTGAIVFVGIKVYEGENIDEMAYRLSIPRSTFSRIMLNFLAETPKAAANKLPALIEKDYIADEWRSRTLRFTHEGEKLWEQIEEILYGKYKTREVKFKTIQQKKEDKR